jgi:hypothetical protein
VKLISKLIEDADALVETDRTELQRIDDPAATYSEFFDDEPLRLSGFDRGLRLQKWLADLSSLRHGKL